MRESFCVKIGWGVWSPGRLGEKVKEVTNIVYFFSHIYSEAPADSIVTKFGLGTDFQDVISCAKFR